MALLGDYYIFMEKVNIQFQVDVIPIYHKLAHSALGDGRGVGTTLGKETTNRSAKWEAKPGELEFDAPPSAFIPSSVEKGLFKSAQQ